MKTKKPAYLYPYNFLSIAYNWTEEEVKANMDNITLAGFYYVMTIIAEQYQKVIELYYRDNKTQKEVGASMGLSAARVQQILSGAIRIFNHANKRSVILRGPAEYLKEKIEEQLDSAYRNGYACGYNDCYNDKQHNFANPSVRDMNLSVRLYNCLTRDGIEDLKQLYATDPKHLMDIRCFGPKCLDELIDVLRLYNLDVQKYIDLKETLKNGNC